MKKRNNYTVILIIIATILVLGYLIFFNVKKNKQIEVNAIVKEKGNNYIVAVDDENNEYLLKTDESINSGERINFVIKNIKYKTPITGDIVKIDTISKEVIFSVTDIPENNPTENNTSETKDNNNEDSNNMDTPIQNYTDNSVLDKETTNNDQANITTSTNDTAVVTYFENLKNEVDNSSELKTSIKEKFVLVVDFLFYDGDINGKTFKELSTKTKLKVLELFLKIDNKIESKYPNYKETISNKGNKVYTNVKNKALELYFDITTDVCKNDPDVCSSAKQGLKDLKTNFSLTWDFIKEISGIGINKLKSWYEIWREIQ